MLDDETGRTETTVEPHRHYCTRCGGSWSHSDEECIGPRFRSYSPYDPDFSCPSCVDPE